MFPLNRSSKSFLVGMLTVFMAAALYLFFTDESENNSSPQQTLPNVELAEATNENEISYVRAIEEKAVAAMRSADSFRFRGEVFTSYGWVNLDLRIDRLGNCSGWYELDGSRTDVLRLSDGSLYVRPANGYWTTASAKRGLWYSLSPGNERVNAICASWTFVTELERQGSEESLIEPRIEEEANFSLISYGSMGGLTVDSAEPHRMKSFQSPGGKIVFLDFDEDLNLSPPEVIVEE